MDLPRVSIIILNWNGWKDTVECLESLYRINYPSYDVIVIDNGSKDGSVQKIKEYALGKIQVSSKFFDYTSRNKPIRIFEIGEEDAKRGRFQKPFYEKTDPERRMILIRNRDNYGFAGGNNVGIKFALSSLNPEYILLLNNDTVVHPDFLMELVQIAEIDKRIGVVGPKILYYKNPKTINSVGARVNWIFGSSENIGEGAEDHGQYDLVGERNAILGACMLIRKTSLFDAKLFDENFFILLEETDLCIRIKTHKYRVMYTPSAKVYHKGEQSRKKMSSRSLYYSYRNRILFIKNHFTGIRKIIGFSSNFFLVLFKGITLVLESKIDYSIIILKAYFDGILARSQDDWRRGYESMPNC